MRNALLVPLTVLLLGASTASSAFAQGQLKGRAADPNGAVLPGVDIVASNGTIQERRVTDASGHYDFAALPAGTYTVTASLAGFVTKKRDGVAVSDAASATLDFVLCVGALAEIDWVLPAGGLRELFHSADVVALVRITDTRPVTGECVQAGFTHTARVLETLKRSSSRDTGATLTFVQEEWVQERTPYRIGQTMVVFLGAREGPSFSRAFGPFGVFFSDDDKVTSWHSYVKTDGFTRAQFLAQLRTFAKERDGR